MGLLSWLFNIWTSPREYGIFVSYSRRDGEIVTPLVQILRLSGNGVFRDTDHIRPGTKWKTVLREAVDSCELLLVFWCHHSAKSVEVQNEYTQALQSGKLLAPILLDETPLNAALSEYQAIDMRGIFWHEPESSSRHSSPRVCASYAPPSPEAEQRARDYAKERLDKATMRLFAGLADQFGLLESRKQA